MRLKSSIDCPDCGLKFETAKGYDMHKFPNSLKCMPASKLMDLGWTQSTHAHVWRRPKGRRGGSDG